MHILFLTDNFPPEVNAPATRTHEHCREWVKAGHTVTVVTCAPNFPKGMVFDGYRNLPFQREEMDGISVIRVWSYITANEGFLKRVLDYTSFMATAMLVAPFIRNVDVIVGTSPQFFTAVAAFAVGAVKHTPYVFEVRDLWPGSIRAVGAMKHGKVLDALEALELFLYRRAAAVVSVTHSFKDDLVARGIDADKIDVITNGVDGQRFQPRAKDPVLERELGLQGKFVAGYIGTHGMAHALETILEAAEILATHPTGQDIRFIFLGEGARKDALKARAESKGLRNVVFLDSVGRAEVARYWSLLDVSIIHLKKDPVFETVIPSKLFECMGMGIPVLHGVAGESARIVEGDGVGLVFPPEDTAALVAGLLRLQGDRTLLSGFRTRGPVAAKQYDRTALASRMLTVLEGLTH